MRSPPISHTHLAGAMRHRPGRTWKETSSFAGCRLKKRKRTGEMVISGGDEFYMCILLPSGSVGCFKSWVFFRLAGIFFVLWKHFEATFQFEHRFFIWRNIFKNDEATFQFYRQTQIQQYEINNSKLNHLGQRVGGGWRRHVVLRLLLLGVDAFSFVLRRWGAITTTSTTTTFKQRKK